MTLKMTQDQLFFVGMCGKKMFMSGRDHDGKKKFPKIETFSGREIIDLRGFPIHEFPKNLYRPFRKSRLGLPPEISGTRPVSEI